MTVQPLDEEAIFHAARAMGSPVERADYLVQACGDNQALRARVEGLLKIYADEKSFAAMPTALLATIDHQPIRESPGTVIGPYKLMEQIGEGGFGLVFVAEQQQPVRRKVALKVIKPGMDTRDVIARFEAERQALALMDHPNIARVFDAGATDSGRPYFVMELVRGIPITEYCDQQHLTPRERLELFVALCHAIQHAHQKGIIHRDVKPSNVLVTEHDGRPVVKVIDFGVAKALSQQLTQHSIYTQFSQMIGTPLYMSPEQATMSGLDIDTRSDIYSLGVLLYELLTGSTPFDRKRLQQAAADELRRIIREEEPPKPSTRLSQSGDRLPSIAALRNTEPAGLSKLVRGDLDWIVMKCLEKDRERRYETANGLAQDIERHLHDEPVAARPQSTAYRFRKFTRRNKVAMLLISAASLTLLLLLAGLAVSNRLIAAERNEKAAALEEAEAQRQRAEKNFVKARMAITGILARAALGRGEWTRLTPALRKTFADETAKFYESLLQEGSGDLTLRYETAVGYRSLATLHNSLNEFELGEKFVRQSITLLEKLVAEKPEVAYRHQLAYSHFVLGSNLFVGPKRYAEAKEALDRGIDLYEQLLSENPDNPDFLEITLLYGQLMLVQRREGADQEREKTVERALALADGIPPTSPNASQMRVRVARIVSIYGDLDAAIATYRRAIELDPKNVDGILSLGDALRDKGDRDEANTLYHKAIELDPKNVQSYQRIANKLYDQEDWDGCIAWTRRAIELNSNDLDTHAFLGLCLYLNGDFDAAIVTLRHVVEGNPKHIRAWNHLGTSLKAKGDLDGAIEAFRRGVEFQPEDATPYRNLVDTLFLKKDWEGANAQSRRAIEMSPRSATPHNYLGVGLFAKGDIEGAIAEYRRALDLDPKFVLARENLGKALQAKGDLDRVLATYREAIKLDPKAGWAYRGLGDALLANSDLDGAIAAFRQAIELDSKNLAAQIGLATTLKVKGNFAESEIIAREGLKDLRARLAADDPQIGDELAQLTSTLLSEEKFAQAEVAARECLNIRDKKLPDDWRTFYARSLLGGCLLGQKKYAEAEPLLISGYEGMKQRDEKISDTAKPRLKEALERLVRLYEAIDQADKVAEWKQRLTAFGQAIEGAAKLSSEGGNYATAFRLARAGDAEQFDAKIRTLIAQDHEKATTKLDMLVLGELRLVAGEIEAAVQAIRAAITKNYGPDFMYKSLGWALLAQGQPTEAREAFQRALGPRRRDDGTFDLAGADPDQMTAAYFLDLLTEDEYINHLKDEESFACFPWFYVAQRREIEGKPEDAIAAYKRCVELGQNDNAHSVLWLAEWRLGMLANKPD